ncbi:F-box only protein 40-like [Brachionichthys hirsutus]|uniref:F-box only protein 40-like n=1 Tax=Brachionichthys hirsutus TaxID=412623 RepID=UPI003604E43A
MSHRSRQAPRVKHHVHCDSCYSRRCKARVEASVCCAVASCRLHCGALFHLCKEEEHNLLCPNVRVPCLNAAFGCPVHLPRSSQAAHLQVCPASVVCCSMEWLRWPSDETDPNSDLALKENVMKETERPGEPLDLAMALVDQSDLYIRLKMKPLYPELTEEEEEEVAGRKDGKKDETPVAGLVNGVLNIDPKEGLHMSIPEKNGFSEKNVAVETAQNRDGQAFGFSKEIFNMTERMFSKEKGGCEVAQASLDDPPENPETLGEGNEDRTAKTSCAENETATSNCPPPETANMGLAPWQEGVLDRLKEKLTPQEYNMYMVHHGRMLLSFGQIQAYTPRDRDFVYGSLEPIPVQTLRSFKVPDSYHYRQRVHLYDIANRAQSESRGVDTSDLGAEEEDWSVDEAQATLLGYAEKEVMGHKISVSKASDGLFVDEGTQTHSFRAAPFKGKTTLAEVTVDRPLELRLQLQSERVSSRHSRATCVFAFLCGHTFHRREFATHFRNVHSDIQTSLSGWFEQRCPLAYLGCTFSRRRFQPSTHKANVTYNQELRSFNLRPTLVDTGVVGPQPPRSSASSSTALRLKRRGWSAGGEDSLSSLPYEVLCHVASFLDSLSLSQLALVSHLMRQVCSSLLRERGMVTLRWERKTYSHGGATWKAQPVWEFSHLFSKVDSWHLADIPAISAHLKVCPYYETSPQSKPVALPGMRERQESSKERLSLINQFTGSSCRQ